ncbi:multidrug resistance efflux transporter family protein [Metabacillus indicus]|uniref:DMT family transporter n=1 Tax=Metabacillus indicus TaxID=246786 RepID=UPI0004930AEA|nr:multidrug resistance efflux transporter family protein [Metabacillus indicus]KEZ50488.1 membrane protein [Metabacillus indicus LMG 22858]
MKEIGTGIIASMFFAVTFILNRSMELAGGSWLWSSSLRFLFMIPFLVLIVALRKNSRQLFSEMKDQPSKWVLWSFTGFVLFYAPITFAAAYGPGWLVAGTWQLTIVAGTLLAPLFYESSEGVKNRRKIPLPALLFSVIIFSGVVLIQMKHASGAGSWALLAGVLPVAAAALAYPLGNRKMMEVCGGRLDTFQRVLGMTLASTPFWIILAVCGYVFTGPPSSGQVVQSFIVAVSSGVIATTLFFIATDRSRHDEGKLASVEATQSTQVLFVLAGEMILFSSPFPGGITLAGIGLIIAGMFMHSYFNEGRLKRISYSRAAKNL